MTGEKLLAALGGDQVGDLRRDKTGKLRPLPLDGIQETRVCDRDRCLIREGRDELDFLVGEKPRYVAADRDNADQLAVQNNWSSDRKPMTRWDA